MNGCRILSNAFYASIDMIMWFFSFNHIDFYIDVKFVSYIIPSLKYMINYILNLLFDVSFQVYVSIIFPEIILNYFVFQGWI